MRNDSERSPLVSVIIPMYNSAKFIPQTLESLLYQTMTDFEVVVIDDCSTDNSVEVVESFSERFGGQLHVIKLPKNSGTSGTIRNFGIQIARGKYIAFLDSDDLYTKTALEELSSLAEEFQADIVHTNQFFILWGGFGKTVDDPAFTDMNELTNPDNFYMNYYNRYNPDKPTLETDDMLERVKKFLSNNYTREAYVNFCRRDFLISNQIFFPYIRGCEDEPFTFKSLCLAKKILSVPNTTYIVRPRKNSGMREQLNVKIEIHKSLRIYIDGVNDLIKTMDDIKFFSEHPEYRYAVLDWYIQAKFYRLQKIYAQIPAFKLNEFVKKEFHTEDAAFAAYMFDFIHVRYLQTLQRQKNLAAENKKLQEELAELKKIMTIE